MKPLSSLSEADYCTLKSMGYLYEIYPEATGDWVKDTRQSPRATPKTNVYKVTLCVIDIHGVLPTKDNVISTLENLPHPEFASVMDIDVRQVEWHDNHLLNIRDTHRAAFDELFDKTP